MDAPVLYFVRVWVHPDHVDRLNAWLEGGHLAEVAAQPGFLWARRVRLQETGEDGWLSYMNVYAVSSLEALNAYWANDTLQARFRAEAAELADVIRVERCHGEVDFATG